jgi:hypothetical protein
VTLSPTHAPVNALSSPRRVTVLAPLDAALHTRIAGHRLDPSLLFPRGAGNDSSSKEESSLTHAKPWFIDVTLAIEYAHAQI